MAMFDLGTYFPITDPTWIFFIVLSIILFAPMIMAKLRIPHIIGMVLAGVLVGQYGLNILQRDASFEIVRLSRHVFRVVGPRVERMVVQTDFENEEAIAYLQHRFKRIGVDKALDAAGACDGDEIRIVGYSFDYESTRMADDMFAELED
jgi:Obg family GTPase CgtA-like protein